MTMTLIEIKDDKIKRINFKKWKEENLHETANFNEVIGPSYKWYFVCVDKQVIGWLSFLKTPFALTSLEFVYVLPKFRGRGYTIAIRDYLVKCQGLKSLTLGRYLIDNKKHVKHLSVAALSGFNKHYIMVFNRNIISEVLVHDSVINTKLSNNFIQYLRFNDVKNNDGLFYCHVKDVA